MQYMVDVSSGKFCCCLKHRSYITSSNFRPLLPTNFPPVSYFASDKKDFGLFLKNLRRPYSACCESIKILFSDQATKIYLLVYGFVGHIKEKSLRAFLVKKNTNYQQKGQRNLEKVDNITKESVKFNQVL